MSNNETPPDDSIIPQEDDSIAPADPIDPTDSIAVTQEEDSIAPKEEEEIIFEEDPSSKAPEDTSVAELPCKEAPTAPTIGGGAVAIPVPGTNYFILGPPGIDAASFQLPAAYESVLAAARIDLAAAAGINPTTTATASATGGNLIDAAAAAAEVAKLKVAAAEAANLKQLIQESRLQVRQWSSFWW